MLSRNRICSSLFLSLVLVISTFAFSQEYKSPETILPEEIIKIILNEVSGQIPFNIETMLSGYNRIRTAEEFEGFLYEVDYLGKILQQYGLDEVKIESLEKSDTGGGWWVGVDAELWMVQPEHKLLSRLSEHPALMARLCDEVDCEGELVFIDRRDISKLKDMDFTGRIILTPEPINACADAFQKGALGVISYYSFARPLEDLDQVCFNMGMLKGRIKNKIFGFKIWPRLGYQLRDMVLSGQKVLLHATSKTANYPWKLDTIFACIKGTEPDKKELMFTAHLLERPAKQGANDNISGSVTLAEIARTITKLIKEGKLERPERSIYFLWGEESSSTMAFFKKYTEMADKILGVINMDMVGENLDENHAFFGIEVPLYSKTSFLDSVPKNFANYVFETNIEKFSYRSPTPWVNFPVPIVEKNGSLQPFRFLMHRFGGGSDHSVFMRSDSEIPALSFNVWPDFWYHTDKDRPDKSDPTQLKRVAFIGTASALAICSGKQEILENLVRITYVDRMAFIQEAVSKSITEISRLKESNGGITYLNAVNNVNESVRLTREALSRIKELTQNKEELDTYLDNVIANVGKLSSFYIQHLKSYYDTVAELNGFKSQIPRPSPEEAKLRKIVPVKTQPVKLSDRFPYSPLFDALGKNPEVQQDIFSKYGFSYLLELFLSVDGKRNLAQIRNLLSFEFQPVPITDFEKYVKVLEDARLIQYKK